MSLPKNLKMGEIARLIPVAADTSKEARAASIFLSTMSTVKPFQNLLLSSIGQKTGKRSKLTAFTEIVFSGTSSRTDRPDGLIILESGKGRQWRALVEAKIGRSNLNAEQVERYVSLAKENNIDAIITLSNQFATIPSHSPVQISKSACKGIALYHWSWIYVWTQANLLLNEGTFENETERYLLTEMARYFGHPSIGVSRFDRMNPEWKDLVTKIQASATIPKHDPALESSVSAWHQEVRDLTLLMSRRLNRTVRTHLPRAHREDPEKRFQDDCEKVLKEQRLYAHLDIPDAAAPVEVVADLVRRSICIYMTLDAPKDKKKTPARINWLVRQLKNAQPENIHIRANWPGRTPSTQAALAEVLEDPSAIDNQNKNSVPTSFEVLLVHDMAGKFSGVKTFIEQLESAVPWFYKNVGQHLRAYVPTPPKIQPKVSEPDGDRETDFDNLSLNVPHDTESLADGDTMGREAQLSAGPTQNKGLWATSQRKPSGSEK